VFFENWRKARQMAMCSRTCIVSLRVAAAWCTDDVLVRYLWDIVVAEANAPKKEGTACTPPTPLTRLPDL
jgi:hypothetical protein